MDYINKVITMSYVLIRSVLMLTLIYIFSINLLSQNHNLGENNILNFEKENFDHGTQNWESFSLENGFTYFANNSGMLEYSGTDWTTYQLPNKTIVRSLCPTDSERIYIGGQDEVGYYEPGNIGQLVYHSIRELVPKQYLPLEDIWEMVYMNSRLYFLSVNKIFIYDESGSVSIINTGNPINFMGEVQGRIYFFDLYNGIYEIKKDNEYELLEWSSAFKYMPVVDVLPSKDDGFLVLTELAGAFIYDGELSEFGINIQDFLKQNRIHGGIILNDGSIGISTQFGGVIVVKDQEVIVEHYSKENGLQNNNILTLHEDISKNLWVGTSNGIDKILRNEPIKTIIPDGENEGAIYDIMRFHNNLFFGTNNGLYYLNLAEDFDALHKPTFRKVPNSNGQVWGLDTLDNKLLIGHNEGALILRNSEAIKISKEPGAWTFLRVDDLYMYVGTYTGIHIYKKKEDEWEFYKALSGFGESSRIIAQVKKNQLWVSHPYRGVYRITHDDLFNNVDVTLYDESLGLPSLLLNYVFNIDGEILVTAKNGIYAYDKLADRFEKEIALSEFIDSTSNTRRLFEYDNELYYINENEVGQLSNSDNGVQKKVFPELKGAFVGGFENLIKLDSNTILACTDKGVKSYSLNSNEHEFKSKIRFRSISLISSDFRSIYDGHGDFEVDPISFETSENAFRFSYGSNDHSKFSKYRYKLVGFEEEWSPWSEKMVKEYNNLSHGSYSFIIEAMNENKIATDPAVFNFTIKPAWYQTKVAYLLYMLFILTAIFSIYMIPNNKYKKEKEELTQANEESETEIERLKNEQLKIEIDHKNRELASSTLHLVQKNETINKLRSEIEQIQRKINDVGAKKELKKVLSVLSDDDRLEQDWESFSNHFDQVHSDFLKRIKLQYPQLSPKDLKMAAYLRLNLSSKEIAPLLNISVRGVEIGRYRLRKKLELDTTVNLSEFMMEY